MRQSHAETRLCVIYLKTIRRLLIIVQNSERVNHMEHVSFTKQLVRIANKGLQCNNETIRYDALQVALLSMNHCKDCKHEWIASDIANNMLLLFSDTHFPWTCH